MYTISVKRIKDNESYYSFLIVEKKEFIIMLSLRLNKMHSYPILEASIINNTFILFFIGTEFTIEGL